MQIGGHVSAAGGLIPAIKRGADIDAEVIQIFVQSPRAFKVTKYSGERLEEYRVAQHDDKVVKATYAHAPYLINLATEKPDLAELSRISLVHNLSTTTAIGGSGVVLHVGSHHGGGIKAVLEQVADNLLFTMDTACKEQGGEICPLLLENAAGSGGTIGRTFEELAMLIEATGDDPRLGVCIDTQHLFASGVAYGTTKDSDEVIKTAKSTFGLRRIKLIHFNDSKVEFASNRDRHENIGDGEIGKAALGTFLSHPALAKVPAVLEVPGDGDGPRASDVALAKKIVKQGQARRARLREKSA